MSIKNVFITGGAGYVGAVLVPKMLEKGYNVSVIDLMIYGEEVLPKHPNLTLIKGDIRDTKLLKETMQKHDALIHLASISNDPSFELNPELGKSINLDSLEPMIQIAKEVGLERFIFASSSSVYGIKEEPNVDETLELEPLTDYSKFKAMGEEIFLKYNSDDFTVSVIRPATVCGYSPRLRLDLVVNILTNLSINKGEITVFGGEQKRPNIHIEDITDYYIAMLEFPKEKIAGKIYNAGYDNYKVKEIAQTVKKVVGDDINIKVSQTDDNRSYHISSAKIKQELGLAPKYNIEDAIRDLKKAFDENLVPNSLTDDKYFNVKKMQNINLK